MKKKKKYTKNKTPKQNVERYSDGLRQIILEQKLPAEAVLKDTLLTMVGCSELWLENYKGLVEYGESMILIQSGNTLIRVEGERLKISHYMEEHMMICGKICSITYLK